MLSAATAKFYRLAKTLNLFFFFFVVIGVFLFSKKNVAEIFFHYVQHFEYICDMQRLGLTSIGCDIVQDSTRFFVYSHFIRFCYCLRFFF